MISLPPQVLVLVLVHVLVLGGLPALRGAVATRSGSSGAGTRCRSVRMSCPDGAGVKGATAQCCLMSVTAGGSHRQCLCRRSALHVAAVHVAKRAAQLLR